MSQLTVARPAPLPSGTSRTRPRRDLRVVDATGAADGGWFRWLCGGLLVAGLLGQLADLVRRHVARHDQHGHVRGIVAFVPVQRVGAGQPLHLGPPADHRAAIGVIVVLHRGALLGAEGVCAHGLSSAAAASGSDGR